MVYIDQTETQFSEKEHAALNDLARAFEDTVPWQKAETVETQAIDNTVTLDLDKINLVTGQIQLLTERQYDDKEDYLKEEVYTFFLPFHKRATTLKRSDPTSTNPMTYLRAMLRMLPGTLVEFDATKRYRSFDEPHDNYYWSDMLESSWRYPYAEMIHPVTTKAALRSVATIQKARVCHVDLFGGDGKFDVRFQNSLSSSGRTAISHIIDRNRKQLTDASMGKNNLPIVVHPPVDITHDPESIWEQTGRPDIVTAIGGLNKGVVTREAAEPVLQSIHRALEPGGYFITTGITPSVFNSTDLQAAGFTVLQKSIPKNIANNSHPRQLYICQKRME